MAFRSNRVIVGKQVFYLDEMPVRPLSDRERATLKRLGIPIREHGIVAMGNKSHARAKKAGLEMPPVFRIIATRVPHRERKG